MNLAAVGPPVRLTVSLYWRAELTPTVVQYLLIQYRSGVLLITLEFIYCNRYYCTVL